MIKHQELIGFRRRRLCSHLYIRVGRWDTTGVTRYAAPNGKPLGCVRTFLPNCEAAWATMWRLPVLYNNFENEQCLPCKSVWQGSLLANFNAERIDHIGVDL